MMRILKEPEVRKNEILNAAEKLFAAKGFEKATVNDILTETGIAKGTFYYYFTSKEEVLDAVVRRRTDEGVNRAEQIAANPGLSVSEKFLAVILAQQPRNETEKNFTPALHEPGNALLHQKSLTDCVLRLTPVLQNIVQEGIDQGIFNTPYPGESVELILAAAITIFDDAWFHWNPEEMTVRIKAFITAMERILGAEPGGMAYIAQAFVQNSVGIGVCE